MNPAGSEWNPQDVADNKVKVGKTGGENSPNGQCVTQMGQNWNQLVKEMKEWETFGKNYHDVFMLKS